MSEGYNGWKNYETWNVALWILNDEALYWMAKRHKRQGYRAFVNALKDFKSSSMLWIQTPDGVEWLDPKIDLPAIEQIFKDL